MLSHWTLSWHRGCSEPGNVPLPRHCKYISTSAAFSSSTFSLLIILPSIVNMESSYVHPIPSSNKHTVGCGCLCYCCHSSCSSVCSLSVFSLSYSHPRSGYPQPQRGLQQIAVGCWLSIPVAGALVRMIYLFFISLFACRRYWRRISGRSEVLLQWSCSEALSM